MKILTLGAATGMAMAMLGPGESVAGPIVAPAMGPAGEHIYVGHRRTRHQERYAYYYGYPWYVAPGAYPYRPEYYRPYYYRPYDRYYSHVGPKLRPWHRRHKHHHGHWK